MFSSVINYICFADKDYIHIVQFCQAFQNVQPDSMGIPGHMSQESLHNYGVQSFLELMTKSNLPEGPSKQVDSKVKNLARLLNEKGILTQENPM